MRRTLLFLLLALFFACPSFAGVDYEATTVAELKQAFEQGELRIRGGNVNQGLMTIATPQTWDFSIYTAGAVVAVYDISLAFGANVDLINVPNGMFINWLGSWIVSSGDRVLTSDNASSLLTISVVELAVDDLRTFTVNDITFAYQKLIGSDIGGVGTLTLTGGFEFPVTWTHTYDQTTRIEPWDAEVTYTYWQMTEFGGSIYRCTDNGCLGSEGDPTVNPEWVLNVGSQVKSMHWGSGSLSADGTNCADAVEVTINSGPKLFTIVCTDSDSSIVYGSTNMPDGWDSTVSPVFTFQALNTAADTGVLEFDFSAMCRADGDAVNATWGSEPTPGSITFTTANDIETSAANTVVPNGTCTADSTRLFWRMSLDATATTTAVATAHLLGVKMEYVRGPND